MNWSSAKCGGFASSINMNELWNMTSVGKSNAVVIWGVTKSHNQAQSRFDLIIVHANDADNHKKCHVRPTYICWTSHNHPVIKCPLGENRRKKRQTYNKRTKKYNVNKKIMWLLLIESIQWNCKKEAKEAPTKSR